MSNEHETIEEITPDFTYVDVGRSFPKAKLVEPTRSGYLLLAAEIDRRPMFLPSSRAKRALTRGVIKLLPALQADERVLETVAFDGLLAPANPGEVLKDRPDVPIARFDFVVLVETSSPETAEEIEQEEPWATLTSVVEARSRRSYRLRAHNVRRMGPVAHRRDGASSSTTSSPIART